MTLKEQLYVCTVARCKTISKASEELHISQPALSIYISNLEKYLNTKLFKRTGKEFQLTYAGEEYVKRAEKMLEMKQEFDQLLQDIHQQYNGRIRVGIQHRRAVALLPGIMEAFMKEYPDIDLEIIEGIHSELVDLYEKEKIDLFIGVFKDELTDAQYTTIGHEQILVALPADHPANAFAYAGEDRQDPFLHLDISHLNRETFLLPYKKQSLRTSVDRILEECHITPRRIIELTYFETIMALVERGIGIGFNREGYISSMIPNRNLHYYRIGENAYSSRIVVAYNRKKVFPDYFHRFVEITIAEAGKQRIENS
jgi:DNA-binding transcriptional LysR family regulator